jgi:hypothetical protein
MGTRLVVTFSVLVLACEGRLLTQPQANAPPSTDARQAAAPAPDTNATGTGGEPAQGAAVSVIDMASALPSLPALINLRGQVYDDAVQITFDPVDGAADYRIYPLPADGDVRISNGALSVRNAVYRCAGDIETPLVHSDDGKNGDGSDQFVANAGVQTTAVVSAINGYQRSLEQAVLGHVYAEAAEGRVAVWALGSPNRFSDPTEQCFNDVGKMRITLPHEAHLRRYSCREGTDGVPVPWA